MIEFESMEETFIPSMKGGTGTVKAKIFTDGNVKIMHLTLEKGVSIGYHRHETNLEIVYVVSGEANCMIDGQKETVFAGCAHYCPAGCTHSISNEKQTPLVLFAVVPELNPLDSN